MPQLGRRAVQGIQAFPSFSKLFMLFQAFSKLFAPFSKLFPNFFQAFPNIFSSVLSVFNGLRASQALFFSFPNFLYSPSLRDRPSPSRSGAAERRQSDGSDRIFRVTRSSPSQPEAPSRRRGHPQGRSEAQERRRRLTAAPHKINPALRVLAGAVVGLLSC